MPEDRRGDRGPRADRSKDDGYRRRDRSRSRDRQYNRRENVRPRSRSRSPRRDNARDRIRDRTPPRGPRSARDRDTDRTRDSPRAKERDRGYDRDRERRNPRDGRTEPANNSSSGKGEQKQNGTNGHMDIDEDDPEAQMRKMMGFATFKSTKNTKVPGNDKLYGVRKEKKTEYRQYMNRSGGFNRPLSPS